MVNEYTQDVQVIFQSRCKNAWFLRRESPAQHGSGCSREVGAPVSRRCFCTECVTPAGRCQVCALAVLHDVSVGVP